MRVKRYIAGLLILILTFPYNLHAAGKITTAVIGVRDGVNDEESQVAVSKTRSLLKSDQNLYVVDEGNTDSVLQYYDRENSSDVVPIKDLLSKAKENYYRFNYVEAKSLVQDVINRLKGDQNSISDHGDLLLDAYLTQGIVLRSMGNTAEARQAFQEAIRLDPQYKLDSRAFSPELVNLFENVRSSSDGQSKGSIKVESNPKVAEVYLNGMLKGVTPLTIEGVPAGFHYLKIVANKYEPVRKEISVKGGKVETIKERLAWGGGETGKFTGKNYVSARNDIGQIEEALQIADLLRVDKVLLINVDKGAQSPMLTARMVDSGLRTGHKPIIVAYNNGAEQETLSKLAGDLVSKAREKIASNPEKYADPPGLGKPELIGGKKHSKISKGVLFGILGGVLAAGLGGGLAAAFMGGSKGGAAGGTGSVNVTFKK